MWTSLFSVAPLKDSLELIISKSVLLSFWDWKKKEKKKEKFNYI